MSEVVICVEQLSKRYTVGRQRRGAAGEGLRHAFQDTVAAPFRALGRRLRGRRVGPESGPNSSESEEFYALRDVSFEVRQGEVLGVVGHNGAGKSTLLKILSRITEPTCGRVGLKGRVASLLEVGTGFHPELTGRENLFLNGAILGMSRAEVKRKFEEIVEFSGVARFIDTPVKRYSSGMYVRLAFAVAAHLDPEVLIVDEVLAVGDAEFQERCLGKMRGIAGEGRTILFVSHNLLAVQALCQRALLLKEGRVSKQGSAAEICENYLAFTRSREGGIVHCLADCFQLVAATGSYAEVSEDQARISIALTCASRKVLEGLRIDVAIEARDDVRVVQFAARVYAAPLLLRPAAPLCLKYAAVIPYLRPGPYTLTVYGYLEEREVVVHITGLPVFNVSSSPQRPECLREGFSALILPRFTWQVQPAECAPGYDSYP